LHILYSLKLLLKTHRAMNNIYFTEKDVETSMGTKYHGLLPAGETSAVIVLRAGAAFEVRFLTFQRLV
jgi:uridine kinase